MGTEKEVSELQKQLESDIEPQGEELEPQPEEEVIEGEEPETDIEDEPEPAPAKPEKAETVPLATFLAEKRARRDLENRLARLEQAATEKQDAAVGPCSAAEAIAAGEIADDDIVTAKMQAVWDANREKRDSSRQHRGGQSAAMDAEMSLRRSIPESHESAGLGIDDVVTAESRGNLTLADMQEMMSLRDSGQVGKAARYLYDKCIERTPELAAKLAALSKTKKTPKGTVPRVPRSRSSATVGQSGKLDLLAAARSGKSEAEIFRDAGS